MENKFSPEPMHPSHGRPIGEDESSLSPGMMQEVRAIHEAHQKRRVQLVDGFGEAIREYERKNHNQRPDFGPPSAIEQFLAMYPNLKRTARDGNFSAEEMAAIVKEAEQKHGAGPS